MLLMPGVIAASAGRVLGSYLFSQGRVIYNTYATFIALGVTLALDLILIPTLEVPGAATSCAGCGRGPCPPRRRTGNPPPMSQLQSATQDPIIRVIPAEEAYAQTPIVPR